MHLSWTSFLLLRPLSLIQDSAPALSFRIMTDRQRCKSQHLHSPRPLQKPSQATASITHRHLNLPVQLFPAPIASKTAVGPSTVQTGQAASIPVSNLDSTPAPNLPETSPNPWQTHAGPRLPEYIASSAKARTRITRFDMCRIDIYC